MDTYRYTIYIKLQKNKLFDCQNNYQNTFIKQKYYILLYCYEYIYSM